jgi:hypothetical protein
MYVRIRSIAGDVSIRSKDCGHTISVNKICERPIQAATDILKHMAAHNASRAFAAIESVVRLDPEAILTVEPLRCRRSLRPPNHPTKSLIVILAASDLGVRRLARHNVSSIEVAGEKVSCLFQTVKFARSLDEGRAVFQRATKGAKNAHRIVQTVPLVNRPSWVRAS